MLRGALSIGGPGTEHIAWESAHDWCARRMRAQIDRIVQAWGDGQKRKTQTLKVDSKKP